VKINKKITCLLLLLLIFAGGKTQAAQDYVPGDVIIKISDNSQVKAIADQYDLQKQDELKAADGGEVSLLKIKDQYDVDEKLEQLNADSRIEFAQPNYIYHQTAIGTNDTYRDYQWSLDNYGQTVDGVVGANDADIDGPEAWSVSEGGENQVVVAIIDDGVAYNHPDLAANMWDGSSCKDENGNALGGCLHGYNFADNNLDPLATAGSHGTHIAGIIGAAKNNGHGIIGVAPHVKIMALKFDVNNMTTTEVIRGFNFAKQNGAKIVNASWAGNNEDPALNYAIESFGGMVVTAAGNDNTSLESVPQYPCNSNPTNIICVAATDQNDQLTTFSNYGTAADVAAPGVNILSTIKNAPGDDGSSEAYGFWDGTSMSTAFVSGEVALLAGYKPGLSVAELKNVIIGSGDDLQSLQGKTLSGKRINLYSALNAATEQNIVSPFINTGISFKSKEVRGGKTKKSKVTLRFDNIQNAASYLKSSRPDFAGATWKPITDGIKLSFKKKATKKYYVKFKNASGIESAVYNKKIKYEPAEFRVIKNIPKSIKQGTTIVFNGKKFSKSSKVVLYLDGKNMVVETDKYGSFSVSLRQNKPKGTYYWYAEDLKTGKKSKKISYKIL
jgi:subtilisin family serine protease